MVCFQLTRKYIRRSYPYAGERNGRCIQGVCRGTLPRLRRLKSRICADMPAISENGTGRASLHAGCNISSLCRKVRRIKRVEGEHSLNLIEIGIAKETNRHNRTSQTSRGLCRCVLRYAPVHTDCNGIGVTLG